MSNNSIKFVSLKNDSLENIFYELLFFQTAVKQCRIANAYVATDALHTYLCTYICVVMKCPFDSHHAYVFNVCVVKMDQMYFASYKVFVHR
jgi:hypothetical protein